MAALSVRDGSRAAPVVRRRLADLADLAGFTELASRAGASTILPAFLPESGGGSGAASGPEDGPESGPESGGECPSAVGRSHGQADAQLARLWREVEDVQRRWRGGATRRVASGLAELDAVLSGGFAAPGIHELLAGTRAVAVHSLALCTAARAAGRSRWILVIDRDGDFYPPAAARLGVALGRLLVVRTRKRLDGLWAAEQALSCAAVAAAVLPVGHVDGYVSRRLQLAAERGGGMAFLLCDHAVSGHSFAATRLRVEPAPVARSTELDRQSFDRRGFDRWSAERLGRRLRITVLKQREGPPQGPVEVELPDDAFSLSAPAAPGHRPDALRRRSVAG